MEITNKQMEPQQRWIMRIVPVVFVFFTIFFPAGLLVYIVTNNIVTAIQNYIIYNFGPGRQSSDDKEPEKEGGLQRGELQRDLRRSRVLSQRCAKLQRQRRQNRKRLRQ